MARPSTVDGVAVLKGAAQRSRPTPPPDHGTGQHGAGQTGESPDVRISGLGVHEGLVLDLARFLVQIPYLKP